MFACDLYDHAAALHLDACSQKFGISATRMPCVKLLANSPVCVST
jgi:hypothetical protein